MTSNRSHNKPLRFGAQVRDDSTVLEKCIIAKVKVLNDRGVDVGKRPENDRWVFGEQKSRSNPDSQFV